MTDDAEERTRTHAENEVFRNFLDSCVPKQLRSIRGWAEDEVVIPSGPSEGYHFDSDRLPYSRLLLEELGDWQRHVVTGPTQSGKSFHAFVLVIMYYVFELGEDVIVGIPDINMAGDKWAEDILPVIEKSQYKDLLPKVGAGSKGAAKLTKVKFGNGRHIRFMSSGGSDKQRAAATARVLVVTETDGMDIVASTSQEGQTKIQQLEGRVRAFGDSALKFFECTVSTEDAFTWVEYNRGTASKIVHKCRACGEYVSPEREDLVGWKEAKDEIEAGELGRFACPNKSCGIYFSEEDRKEMNLNARLIHRGQTIDSNGVIHGEPPRTNTLGFRWSGFQNLLYSVSMLAREEWLALHSENPIIADIARNQQAWAKPSKDPNIEKIPLDVAIVQGIDERYLGRCSGFAKGELPEGSERPTAAIDCSHDLLQWSVEAKVGKRIHVVDYDFFRTSSPHVVGYGQAVFNGIMELVPQICERYPDLSIGLIDSGNWTSEILDAIAQLQEIGAGLTGSDSAGWHPSHGLGKYLHPNRGARNKRLPKGTEQTWHISTTHGRTKVINFDPDTLKHRVHGGFLIRPLRSGEYVPGAISLWGSDPEEHAEFARQVMAEEWVDEFIKGKEPRKHWKKIRRDNHMLDVCVLNMVGRMVANSGLMVRRSFALPGRK